MYKPGIETTHEKDVYDPIRYQSVRSVPRASVRWGGVSAADTVQRGYTATVAQKLSTKWLFDIDSMRQASRMKLERLLNKNKWDWQNIHIFDGLHAPILSQDVIFNAPISAKSVAR